MTAELLMLLPLGLLSGLLAGLLGIGGGLVMVPVLLWWLPRQGVPSEAALHVAVATSLAAIILTAAMSGYSHSRHGAVEWRRLPWLVPALLLGSLTATDLVARLPRPALQLFVAGFCLFAAWQMLRGRRALVAASDGATPSRFEGLWMVGGGGLIGAVSAAVGIGGGSLSVPFLSWRGVALARAVATSAVCGLPIAIAGTIGYLNQPTVAGLGPLGKGLVAGDIALAVGLASLLTAPLGARLTHRWPVQRLRRVFAGLLLLIGLLLAGRAIGQG
jgi:uncharacterized membrane protein YfcA